MKALVVGGTGFLGSYIADELLRKGFEVRATTRQKSASELKNVTVTQGVEYIYADVLEPDSMIPAMHGVDFVFTCFGLLGKWGVPDQDYRNVNVLGLQNVLNAIPGKQIRQLIHISSAGVLGPLPNTVVADESYPFNPSNIYERTKCEAEEKVIRHAGQHGVPFTIIRPEFVYGPGDMHVFGLFRAVKDHKFLFIGKGESLLHPTYVDDFVRGVFLCIGNKIALGKTYLITGRQAVSVRELSTAIASATDVRMPSIGIPTWIAFTAARAFESVAKIVNHREPLLTRARVKFFTENRAFDCSRARQELGYAPEVGLDEGIRRTVAWYREKGLL
jgi:nucleoside-diphosphate-sugar epimerase